MRIFAKASADEIAKQRTKIDACLNCNLPEHCCCGMPSKCRENYEKYKIEMEKAKAKWSQSKKIAGRKRNAGEESYGKKKT